MDLVKDRIFRLEFEKKRYRDDEFLEGKMV